MIHELLRLEDLSLSLNGVKQIQHMNFAVVEGRIAGVAGPAGGGKTALAKALCGELTPDHGRILYKGSEASQEQLASMSIRFSWEDHMLQNLPVKEQLIIMTYQGKKNGLVVPRGQIQSEYLELLSSFELEEYLDKSMMEVPPSVQHRFLMLGAVIQGKRVLILDRISDNYTDSETKALMDCIDKLRDLGISVLYLTGNYLDNILWHMDHVTVIRNGQRIKELSGGTFTEELLYIYMYGFRPAAETSLQRHDVCKPILDIDNFVIPEDGLIPVLDVDGSINQLVDQLKRKTCRTINFLTAEGLYSHWIEEMSVLDNILLLLARRLCGPVFSMRRTLSSFLCTECMEQTGLSLAQMKQPFSLLTRIQRFRLLYFLATITRPEISVIYKLDAGADPGVCEQMCKTAVDFPGTVIYISGEYSQLKAFGGPIYELKSGTLRKGFP